MARAAHDQGKDARRTLRAALGYCIRQRAGIARFLEDARLRTGNNLSESALRKVVQVRSSAGELRSRMGHVYAMGGLELRRNAWEGTDSVVQRPA